MLAFHSPIMKATTPSSKAAQEAPTKAEEGLLLETAWLFTVVLQKLW